jgi:hypothetical protein
MFDRGVVHVIVDGYIVDHYRLMFDQTVMVNNIAIHNNMNHSSVKHETVMVNNITNHNNKNNSSVKHEARYIVDHYCLMFDRGVVHVVVVGYIVDHYCFMFDRGVNGQQYNPPQQHEQLLCQTSSRNGQQYN